MTDHSVPPTHADLLDDDISPRPAWPKVIGIISIVISSAALFCGVVGVVMQGMGMTGAPPDAPPPPTPPDTMYVYAAVNSVANLVLLSAGIATTLRKPLGRPLHLVHAALKIPVTIWGLLISLAYQEAQQEWSEQVMGADAAAVAAIFGLILMAVFSAISFGWPLFLLVWFGLIKRKSADIAEGAEEIVA